MRVKCHNFGIGLVVSDDDVGAALSVWDTKDIRLYGTRHGDAAGPEVLDISAELAVGLDNLNTYVIVRAPRAGE